MAPADRRIFIVTAISLGLFIAILHGCSNGISQPTSSNWPPRIGEQYQLGAAVKDIGCFDSDEAVQGVAKAIQEKDNEGYERIGIAHGLSPAAGDVVRVLDFNMLSGHLHVRIRSGHLAGSDCWFLVGNENHGLFARHVE